MELLRHDLTPREEVPAFHRLMEALLLQDAPAAPI